MAGDLPKRSTSGRKQWNLQDGTRHQLRILRSQLASDGCSESQVFLAKQLLDGSQQYHSHSEKKENESLGVYWLIKASQQGNEEATRLLKTCLKTGKGISEHNFLDVKSCIDMTQNEKLTRKAAREIFASLSNGRDYITTDQLQKEILAVGRKNGELSSDSLETDKIRKEASIDDEEETSESDCDTDWTVRLQSKHCSMKLTEDNLVSAAIDYSQGNLPLMSRSLDLSPNLQLMDDVPYIYRSILNPWFVLKKFHLGILHFVCWKLDTLYSKSDIRLFLLLVAYALYNFHCYIHILPLVVYYISFIFMILTTYKMLQNQRDLREYRLWSSLFLCYSGGNLNAEQAEHQYLKKNLKPYGQFFLALLLNLFVFSALSKQSTPYSEMAVISFLLTFLTLFGFMPEKSSNASCGGTLLFSFLINVLAKYAYDTDQGGTQDLEFFDMKTPFSAGYVIGNCMEFCYNFRPVLYIAIPFFLIQLASKQNWRGTYKFLIPHCVTLSWLQLCIIGSQGSSIYGLLRGVFALVGFLMFLPFVGLTSVILPAMAITKWLVASSLLSAIGIFIFLTCITFFLSFYLAQSSIRKYTSFFQIIIMLTSLVILLKNMNQKNKIDFTPHNDEIKYLPWEVFQKFCYEPSWQEENIALSQLNCAGLENSFVFWDGYIHSIKIKSVFNVADNILKKFPKQIDDYLRCLLGEEISNSVCEHLHKNMDECRILHLMKKTAHKCTLQNYDEYIFEITMKMSVGIWGKRPEMLVLVLDDFFKNITMKLKSGDYVWFKGELFNNELIGADGILGGYKPHISLKEIGCHSCSVKDLGNASKTEKSFDVFQDIYTGLTFILNVLFNPILLFE